MHDASKPRLCRVAGRSAIFISSVIDGRRHRISTGTADPIEAQKALLAYIADLNNAPAPTSATIGAILDAYLADRTEVAGPGLERIRWSHKALQRHFGSRLPESLDDTAARLYARLRAKEGGGMHGRCPGPATIRTELVALKTALRWAAKQKPPMLAELPDFAAALPKKAQPRERWLTRAEADRLLAGCAMPHVRLFVLIGMHTGARHRTILGLTWDRVDLERRVIDFREPGKARTRKRQVPAPINDTLHAELVEAKKTALTPCVVSYGGRRLASAKVGFREACKRAGLRGVTPHVLRHTVGTWLAQAGVSMWNIAGLLGDTLATVEQNYAHHAPEYLAQAARALG